MVHGDFEFLNYLVPHISVTSGLYKIYEYYSMNYHSDWKVESFYKAFGTDYSKAIELDPNDAATVLEDISVSFVGILPLLIKEAIFLVTKNVPTKLVSNTVKIACSVNGKVRATLEIEKDLDDEAVKAIALENDNVKRNLEGKEIKKVIVVKNKIINIVAL